MSNDQCAIEEPATDVPADDPSAYAEPTPEPSPELIKSADELEAKLTSYGESLTPREYLASKQSYRWFRIGGCLWPHEHTDTDGSSPQDFAIYDDGDQKRITCAHVHSRIKQFPDYWQYARSKQSANTTTGAATAKTTVTQTKRTLRIRALSSIVAKPNNFFWKPYFPWGEFILLSGDPGTYKSGFAQYLAACLTVGKKFSDYGTTLEDCEIGSALIMSAEEDPEKTMTARGTLMGGDTDRMLVMDGLVYDKNSTEPFVCCLTSADIPMIEEGIQKFNNDGYNVKMLVIDPIAVYGGDLNLNQSTQMRKVTTPLSNLAKKYDMLVVGIRHNRKADDGVAIYKGSGSIDGTGAARSELQFVKDGFKDEDTGLVLTNYEDRIKKFVAVHVKCNLAIEGPSIAYSVSKDGLTIDGLSAMTQDDLVNNDGKDKGPKVANWLKAFLADGPMPGKEIKKISTKIGFSERALDRASIDLKIVKKPAKFKGEWIWSLPDTGTTAGVEGVEAVETDGGTAETCQN